MMRASVYSRKSNDDSDRNEENKSVTRQVERSRAFATSKGWSVNEAHVFVDDNVSGDERSFGKRDGLKRLLNHLKEFDCIVMSELSRLGRHQVLTSHALHQIEKAGVQVWFYLDGTQCKFDTSIDRFLVAAVGFAAEVERERAGQRSRDALERKAAAGFCAGGACFGYDLVPVYTKSVNGEQCKSHTDYKIHEEQAAVVRNIFKTYADGGKGIVTIAKNLNADRVPSPQRGKRGTGSWAPGTVRAILHRVRYVGVIPFSTVQTIREDLRIVDAKLWGRVQQRLKEVAGTYVREKGSGQWWGRPSSEKYLLTGLGLCTVCGKRISIVGGCNGQRGRREKMLYYGCVRYRTRGHTVCTNGHLARMERLDGAVLEAIERQVLQPEAIAYTVEKAAEIIERELRKNPDKPQQLEAEARKLRKELERFLRLIAEGKAPESVLVEIRRREERLKELEHERAALVQEPPAWSLGEIRAMCGARLRRFNDLLHGDVPVARQALRKLLPAPLRIAPVTFEGRRTLSFEGETTLGPLLDPTYIGNASTTRL